MSAQENTDARAPRFVVVPDRYVGVERRTPSDRRTSDAALGLCKTPNTIGVEELVEAQAATEEAQKAIAHAVAAAALLLNELKYAKSASIEARRAAHRAAGVASGANRP